MDNDGRKISISIINNKNIDSIIGSSSPSSNECETATVSLNPSPQHPPVSKLNTNMSAKPPLASSYSILKSRIKDFKEEAKMKAYARRVDHYLIKTDECSNGGSRFGLSFLQKNFAISKRKCQEARRANNIKKNVRFWKSKLMSASTATTDEVSSLEKQNAIFKLINKRAFSLNNENIYFSNSTVNENAIQINKLTDVKSDLISPKSEYLNTSAPQLFSSITNFCMKQSSSSSFLVELRAIILKIGDIDTLNDKFYAEAFVEAKWIDFGLSSATKYDPSQHWNPKLYILNSHGELKQQIWHNQFSIAEYCEKQKDEDLLSHKFSASKQKLGGVGSVISERRRISGQFWQTLDLKHFPADVQTLTISVSTAKQSSEVKLVHCKDKVSSVNIKYFVDTQEWRLYKHVSIREYIRDSVFSDESFPAVDFAISAARRPMFYYWNAFFLIFLITISSLTAFSIKCHQNYSRIQTTCTLLLTSVSFKWVINRSLPTVSYMTSLDKYSITCIIIICLQTIWHALISASMAMDQKCVYPFSFYDFNAFVLFFCIQILVQVVFIVWFLKNACKKRAQLGKLELDYANQMIGKRSTRLKSILYGI